MPVRFARLRLAGFKSFAEPVEFEILPGLTGIVGPNGCGKSNIVDALRFIMGESSARTMRGAEAEDLIFGGTAARPARNLAEVTLTLEAEEHELPAPLESGGAIAFSRLVERGRGSVFRINGREARARDVQALFADLGSGARSSALVGQGRVAELIAARPEARRSILDEAAGIVGLHARRHEAELKLAATEANLARASELRTGLEQQLVALKRQARQANRYRNLRQAIRTSEAELLAIEHARAAATLAAQESALEAARGAALATAEVTTRAADAAKGADAALPALRAAEQSRRAEREQARLRCAQLTAEGARVRAELAATTTRLAELDRDLAHSGELARDAAAADARLSKESDALTQALEGQPGRLTAARATLEGAREAREAAGAIAEREAAANATLTAQAATFADEESRARKRRDRLIDERRRIEAERSGVAAKRPAADSVAAAEAAATSTLAALVAARTERDRLETARAEALALHEAARARFSAAAAERARLQAEIEARRAVLVPADRTGGPALAETLEVPPGLEAAFAAAFGEALEAGSERWQEMPSFSDPPALPDASTALADLVRAPRALSRALALIGVFADPERAAALQQSLAPGQTLVSREGGLWRWDGYTIPPGTPHRASVRLAERNRLVALEKQLTALDAAATRAETERDEGARSERAATTRATESEARRRTLERAAEEQRRIAAALRRDADGAASRISVLDERLRERTAELAEAEDILAKLGARRASLPDPGSARQALDAARAALANARAHETTARGELATLEEKATSLGTRRDAIARERAEWAKRAEGLSERRAQLTQRRAKSLEERRRLVERPQTLEAEQSVADETLARAEASSRAARQALDEAEAARTAAEEAWRSAERDAAAAHAAEIAREGTLAEARVVLQNVEQRIGERLGDDAALPDVPPDADREAATRARLERLLREREGLGPVNLRAEIEAAELTERAAAIAREEEELGQAIAKLRGSIGRLNHAGRERLAQVFTEVDRHFQALFLSMFGGGRAHLAMVGSEDPLVAGLEIYAQPPGKKLAQLGLLSGGEQALVALSLIFAVFRCNPGPIAVLDEVDAPFDDANVERFARLVTDVARASAARVLVVTHHPLTMTRMDRLYGVTMQERGVSRLLSVDLATGTDLADPSRLAAA